VDIDVKSITGHIVSLITAHLHDNFTIFHQKESMNLPGGF